MKVELTEEEWLRVLNLLGAAPYIQVQSLIAKISEQLQAQKFATPKLKPVS
jgi:hypothetical protein